MKGVSRRDVLKTGLMVPAVAAVHGLGPLGRASEHAPLQASSAEAAVVESRTSRSPNGAGRERQLLDFGWRFHLGNADDPAKDFGFGSPAVGAHRYPVFHMVDGFMREQRTGKVVVCAGPSG
jgi:beta-galactosidase